MSPANPPADTSAAWAAWTYPAYSGVIWGPLILLALILAIVARTQKLQRPRLATTTIVLSATFPILALLVLALEAALA